MDELKYIKFRAKESTPLTTLKGGELVVKNETKDYVRKGTVMVGAINTIMITHEGKKHAVKVIQTEDGRYAPSKLFDVYVDEFSDIAGKSSIQYKSKVYRENNLVKYAVPAAAVALGLYIAHKRGIKGSKLVLTGFVSLFVGLTPYFYLKNKK